MNRINIKVLTEDALSFIKNNIELVTEKIINNEDNAWIYETFPQPMFIEKKYLIDDFNLIDNPESLNKEIDFKNSITMYNNLKNLPRYVLCDVKFWLWLHFDKFYKVTRNMMQIKSSSTVYGHWLHGDGVRRGLMFGVLSRCYYRVALTIDTSLNDKYELTKWVIDFPERFRNLTWRTFSSELHIVRGAIKGEKKAVDENPSLEKGSYYTEIAKYISLIGSVRLLDAISEEDMSLMIYEKMIKLMNGQ